MIGLFWKKGQLDSWLFFVRSVGDLNRDPAGRKHKLNTTGPDQLPGPHTTLLKIFKIIVDKMYLNIYYDGSLT